MYFFFFKHLIELPRVFVNKRNRNYHFMNLTGYIVETVISIVILCSEMKRLIARINNIDISNELLFCFVL